MNLQGAIEWYMVGQRSGQLFRLFKVLDNESVIPKKQSDPDESEGYVYPGSKSGGFLKCQLLRCDCTFLVAG